MCTKYCAKVKEVISYDGSLADFEALKEKGLNWKSMKEEYHVKNSHLPIDGDSIIYPQNEEQGTSSPPTRKKRKLNDKQDTS